MIKAFTQHPETVGESYFEHLGSAWGFAATMAVAAMACLLHGLFPFAFQASGSRRIRDLHERKIDTPMILMTLYLFMCQIAIWPPLIISIAYDSR